MSGYGDPFIYSIFIRFTGLRPVVPMAPTASLKWKGIPCSLLYRMPTGYSPLGRISEVRDDCVYVC